MNFEASTHRKRWLEKVVPSGSITNDDLEDTLAMRRKRNNADPTDTEEKRRKMLVVRGCLGKAHIIGSSMGYSQNLRLTALAYIRRYFAVEPLEGNDLAVMILTAFYLAGKVEEELGKGMEMDKRGVNMNDLCNAVKSKRRSMEEYKTAAIRNEMKLLVGLNFDLLCFHPLKSALTLWEQLKEKVSDAKVHESLKAIIFARCEGCYLVDDLIFRYPHSFLGATALLCAIRTSSSLSDSQKPDLILALREKVIELCPTEVKPTVGEQLERVANQLEEGMMSAKAKEADEAYMDYLKRGSLTPPH